MKAENASKSWLADCDSVETASTTSGKKCPVGNDESGRPESLSSWFVEVSFVFTAVSSLMICEYFISGFNVVLSPVSDALSITASQRTWTATAISLTTAVLLQPFARLCDIYGCRNVFLCGQAWTMVWSLVGGFSSSGIMLILCRSMQGIGQAAFLPSGLALLGLVYRPGRRKNFVFAVYSAFASIGFYAGIFAGALSFKCSTWRWYFWAGACMNAAVALVGWCSIPRNLDDINSKARMDWWGAATMVGGLVLVVCSFTNVGNAADGWKSPEVVCMLVLGIVLVATTAYIQARVSEQPLLPPDLFKVKYMKRLTVGLFCCYGVFGIYMYYATTFMENIMGAEPTQTALWFTPLAVGGICLSVGGGMLLHILSNTILLAVSCAGFSLSMLCFSLIPGPQSHSSNGHLYWAYIFPAMLATTIGIDIVFNVSNVFITTAMPNRLQASAGGLISSLLSLGFAFWLGVAELVNWAVLRQGGDSLTEVKSYRISFWLGLALALVSFALMITVRIGPAKTGLVRNEEGQSESRH